jgi:hypothetical protein
MRLFGQHYYEENGTSAINIFERVLEAWCDIGKME